MQRGAFLATLAAACTPRLTWAEVGSPAFLAAGKEGDVFVLHDLTTAGQSLFRTRRGRCFCLPSRHLRAGAGLWNRHRLTQAEGLQFNGHGTFSADGSLLMTSEVVADT